MSISQSRKKIKDVALIVRREWPTILMIILAVSASFGLGRLSAKDSDFADVEFEKGNVLTASAPKTGPVDIEPILKGSGEVVASKNGTKYHFPWCSGGKAISEANKIIFATIEDARAAGYLPAANCKGLE